MPCFPTGQNPRGGFTPALYPDWETHPSLICHVILRSLPSVVLNSGVREAKGSPKREGPLALPCPALPFGSQGRSNRGQMKPKMPREASETPKRGQERPKGGQREARGRPREAKGRPRGGQGEAKRGQRKAKGRPRGGQERPKGGQRRPKGGQRETQRGPRQAKPPKV